MLPKRVNIAKLLILTLSVGVGLVVSLSAVMGITQSGWWQEHVGGTDADPTGEQLAAESNGVTPGSGQVMGVTDEGYFTADSLVFRIATRFEDVLSARVLEVDERLDIAGEVNLSGPVNIANDITAQGSSLDLGGGTITASNIVYSIQGENGEIELVAGDGVTIDGLTISNADRGSEQSIFKNIKIGSNTISADNNDDTFTLSGGTGVTLSSSGSIITFSSENLSGWNRPSSGIVSLITSGDKVGIGTANPSSKLELDSGTSGVSGLEFTRLTSASSVGVGGGKVLSVDSGGKVILVSDQTGGDAEDILPSADEGGTLFFNGTNWVSTTNLYHNDGEVGISTTNPQGRFHLNTNDATKIGAIFQAESSQTANLMEWRNSAGSILSYIDADGIFNGSANVEGSINPGLTEGYVTFQGADGITGSNNLFWDNDTGRLGIGTTSSSYKLDVTGVIRAQSGFRTDTTGNGGIGMGVTPPNSYNEIKSAGAINLRPASNDGVHIYGASAGDGAPFGLVDGDNVGYFAKFSPISSGGLAIEVSNDLSSWTTTEALRIDNSGKVGIGTTSPSTKLHISGTTEQLRLAYDASNYTSFTVDSLGNLTFADSGTSIATFGQSQAAFDVPVAFRNAGDVAVANDLNFTNITASYITSDSPLYIQAGNAAESESLYLSSAGSGAVYVDDDLYVTSVLYGSDGTAAAPSLSFENDTDTGLFSANSNTELGFAVGGSERVRVDSSGNVGIGTTEPGFKLDLTDAVNGTIAQMKTTSSAGDVFLAFDSDSSALAMKMGVNGHSGTFRQGEINVSTNHPLNFATNNTGRLTLSKTGGLALGSTYSIVTTDPGENNLIVEGKIGIGTTNPQNVLEVAGYMRTSDSSSYSYFGNNGWDFEMYPGHDYLLKLNSDKYFAILNRADSQQEVFRISNSGFVGIGTTAPTSLLHLDSSNTATFGKSLAIFNHDETQDILTASASGTTKFVVDESGNTFVGNLDTSSTSAVCFESATKNGAALNKLTDCDGSPADLAEYYPAASLDADTNSDSTAEEYDSARTQNTNLPEPGDIVSIGEPLGIVTNSDGTTETYFNVTKSTKAYDSKMLGIVSTKAHTIMGEDVLEWAEHAVAVGLTGRVPVKIDSNSAPIKAGDFITSSSEPGFGQKAEDNGYTVGKALEDWNCEEENGSLKYLHLCTDTIMVTLNQSVHMSGEAVAATSSENPELSSTENDLELSPSLSSLISFDGDDALFSTAGELKFQDGSIKLDAKGNIKISKGVIYGNDSFRGQEAVEAGKSEIRVGRSWESAPVSVTATAQFDSYVWIEDLNQDGFTIKIKDAPDEEAKVFWTAIW